MKEPLPNPSDIREQHAELRKVIQGTVQTIKRQQGHVSELAAKYIESDGRLIKLLWKVARIIEALPEVSCASCCVDDLKINVTLSDRMDAPKACAIISSACEKGGIARVSVKPLLRFQHPALSTDEFDVTFVESWAIASGLMLESKIK